MVETEWTAKNAPAKRYCDITLRVTEEMHTTIHILCAKIGGGMNASIFCTRAVRRETNNKNVVQFEKIKSTSKVTHYLPVRNWELRFTKNQKVIRAIVQARMVEEQLKLEAKGRWL